MLKKFWVFYHNPLHPYGKIEVIFYFNELTILKNPHISIFRRLECWHFRTTKKSDGNLWILFQTFKFYLISHLVSQKLTITEANYVYETLKFSQSLFVIEMYADVYLLTFEHTRFVQHNMHCRPRYNWINFTCINKKLIAETHN